MCAIGNRLGTRTRALITRMDQPLGRAVGNAVEVEESIACLRGEGPADLVDLSVELAAEMLVLGAVAADLPAARSRCRQAIADGSALERFRRVIAAQGGDPWVVDDPARLPAAGYRVDLPAPRSGYVQRLAASTVGHATMRLGAGRARVDSAIDPSVGVWLHRKLGEPVAAGEPLCTVLAAGPGPALEAALADLAAAYTIGEQPNEVPALIIDRLDS
jgi:pyrimidine-nucleoside phosphorylase/thymidine phosphorylase